MVLKRRPSPCLLLQTPKPQTGYCRSIVYTSRIYVNPRVVAFIKLNATRLRTTSKRPNLKLHAVLSFCCQPDHNLTSSSDIDSFVSGSELSSDCKTIPRTAPTVMRLRPHIHLIGRLSWLPKCCLLPNRTTHPVPVPPLMI